MIEALEHLVRGIVSYPEDVAVKELSSKRGANLQVTVNPHDMGRVIGKSGKTATALRTVLGAVCGESVRIDFVEA